ncbi:hypothetical protein LBMAG33_7440 [Candidatus Levyibacteriota bacterium]|nr:hypothetical protein [Candidatus Levybacteria bacterium]GDX62434.1 hypothetical protein LBMAG33_7440 [Candidatus Levybacteria bacterium]
MKSNRLLDLKNLKFEVRDVMRYDDVGDYFDNKIIAYDFKDDIITNAIFLHEFIEYMLIKSSGIDASLIDRFDTDDDAPEMHPREYELYEKFHDMSNRVERQFIENLGLNWDDYDKTINTKKIKTAVKLITEELHKEHPDEVKIQHSREVVRESSNSLPNDEQKNKNSKNKV